MNTRNVAKATTLVATAILAMTAGLTSAHADTGKAATANPIESTSATDSYQQSLTAEDGTVVTFTLDQAAPTLAGSLVGAGAGVITSAMITEAGRLCK